MEEKLELSGERMRAREGSDWKLPFNEVRSCLEGGCGYILKLSQNKKCYHIVNNLSMVFL